MNPTSSLDLDLLADSTNAKVGVAFDENGDPTSGFVIVGKDSEQYREAARLLRIAGIRRGSVKATRIDTKTEDGAAEFDRVLRSNEDEIAVAVVTDWFGFSRSGEPLAFSVDALRGVLAKRPTWRDKISAALEAEDSFLPQSSPN